MFIVTGAGSGLGRALAVALAARGQRVLAVGRRESALQETAALSPLITYCCADVATSEGRENIALALDPHELIEGLIHNAGLLEPIAPLSEMDESAWQKTLNTNLTAPLFLTQLLLPRLSKGRVLHIGSGAAYFPIRGWSAYCVSKAGLSMLTRCWQHEGIEPAVASVMPGIIDTDMQALARQATHLDPAKQQFFVNLHRQKKLLQPETVALFLCWLLLDVDKSTYLSKEWDIYDRTHHASWLVAPHHVWDLNE